MRRIGQNFLVDRDVLSRIADYAELNPGDSVLEIGIDEYRVVLCNPYRLFDVGFKFNGIVGDLHCPAPKNKRRPDQYGITDLFCSLTCFCFGIGRTVCRAGDIEFVWPKPMCPLGGYSAT